MWDLPGPGIKPESSALAGRFFTTEPPGKPLPGIYSNKNACQQLTHKESFPFSHINILGCLMKGLFFQISEFCSWWMFPNHMAADGENPNSWLQRKWPPASETLGWRARFVLGQSSWEPFYIPGKKCFWCSFLIQLLVSTFPWLWGPSCGIITMWVNIAEVTQTSRPGGRLNKCVGQLHPKLFSKYAERLDPTHIF